MTIQGVADAIDFSDKSVGNSERRGKRCDKRLIKALAEYYKIAYDDIILPEIETEVDAQYWIERAIEEYDGRVMDYGRAIKIAKAVIRATDEQSPARAKSCIALASFKDHVGDPRYGIRLLNFCFFARRKSSAPKAIRDLWCWALYTRGFLRRRYAESLLARVGSNNSQPANTLLTLATSDLKASQGLTGKKDVAGIQHHLGVIKMLEGCYREARQLFRRSIAIHEERLEKRKKKRRCESEPFPSIRLGYSYRRLALCCLYLGFEEHAIEHFREAKRIAFERRYKRLLREIRSDLDAWGISIAEQR